MQAAPSGLASTVIAGSLAAAVAPAMTSYFLKTLLITMKAKLMVSVAVVVGTLLLVGTVAVHHFGKSQAAAEAAEAKFLAEQKLHLQPAMPILRMLLTHAADHGGAFPSSLAQFGISDDRFEWIGGGMLADSPSPIPILREKQSWRSATGKTGRVYGYSDGHAQVLTLGSPGYSE